MIYIENDEAVARVRYYVEKIIKGFKIDKITSSDDATLITAAILVWNSKRSRGYYYDVTDFLSVSYLA